jgi:hypothetical protein
VYGNDISLSQRIIVSITCPKRPLKELRITEDIKYHDYNSRLEELIFSSVLQLGSNMGHCDKGLFNTNNTR